MPSESQSPNGRNAPQKFIREHLGEEALDDGGDEPESGGDADWRDYY